MYDVASWSLAELWGFKAIKSDQKIENTSPVTHVSSAGQLIGKGPYVIQNSSVNAVAFVNDLIQKGVSVYRANDGDPYVESQNGSVLQKAVQESGLQVETSEIPEGAVPLKNVKVAVFEQDGSKLALERIGFDVTKVNAEQVLLADYLITKLSYTVVQLTY